MTRYAEHHVEIDHGARMLAVRIHWIYRLALRFERWCPETLEWIPFEAVSPLDHRQSERVCARDDFARWPRTVATPHNGSIARHQGAQSPGFP